MSEDIYGEAYEAFLDEIYQNGGGEPSAVRAAVDCAVKALRAELDAERERADKAVMELKRHMPISKYNGLGIEEWKAQADALRAQLDEAREVLAEAVQWLRVSDLPCEMTIFRADAVLEASSSANGDDSDA